MKKKTQYQDRILYRNPEDDKKMWKEYEPDESDVLILYATIEPVGAIYTFEDNEERRKSNRKAAWHNAVHYAELLYRQAPHRQYVVSDTTEVVRVFVKANINIS